MAPLIALLPVITSVIDKIFPDKAAADAAKLEVLRMQQSGELAALQADTSLALAQIGVNKADAAGASPMQRNGRPFILWVCGVALAWDTVARPMITFGAALAGHPLPPIPNLSTEQLYGLLFGLLGLGGLRSIEKVKGVA